MFRRGWRRRVGNSGGGCSGSFWTCSATPERRYSKGNYGCSAQTRFLSANPIDIANPFVAPAAIKDILLYAAKDENVDIHILIQLLYHYKSIQSSLGNVHLKDITPHKELVKACSKAMEAGGKPVMLVLPNFKQEEDAMEIEEVIRETRRLFTEAGMPVFDDVKNALRATAAISGYYRHRKIFVGGSMK